MKRGRGRGGRKPSNNLNRTLESNGPDVKVRGTAHQICDKYQALARDAHASGDRIAYENYLQHAEHYHRIIVAAQQAAQDAAPQQQQRDSDNDEEAAEAPKAAKAKAAESDAADNDGDDNNEEAPRRARRGRRTRTPRAKANGSGDAAGDSEAAAETA